MRTILVLLCMSAMSAVAIPGVSTPYRVANVLVSKNTQKTSSDNSLSSHLLDLLPEFADAINGITAKGGLGKPAEMIATFFPIIRKAMEAQAAAGQRSMSKKEEGDLELTETVITLCVGVMDELMTSSFKNAKDVGKAITSLLRISRPIVEENAKREGRQLTTKEKTFLYYFESGYQFSIEAMEAFAKDFSPENMIEASGKVAEYIMEARAKSEGRELSWEEKDTIKDYKKQIIEVSHITKGFSGFNTTDKFIANFMRLMRFVMVSNAKAELPKRWALTWEEEKLLKTTEASLKQTDRLITDINRGSITTQELDSFGKNTRKMWEVRAKVE
ncbi:unnamed protein product, partial [Meganyctiphanes norvegica]